MQYKQNVNTVICRKIISYNFGTNFTYVRVNIGLPKSKFRIILDPTGLLRNQQNYCPHKLSANILEK